MKGINVMIWIMAGRRVDMQLTWSPMFRGQQQQTLLGRTRGQPISPGHKHDGINHRGQMQIGYRPNRCLRETFTLHVSALFWILSQEHPPSPIEVTGSLFSPKWMNFQIISKWREQASLKNAYFCDAVEKDELGILRVRIINVLANTMSWDEKYEVFDVDSWKLSSWRISSLP